MMLRSLFAIALFAPCFAGCLDAPDSETQDRAALSEPSTAAPGRGAFHVIKNIWSGKCLQPLGGSIAEATPIVQSDCGDETSPTVLWDLVLIDGAYQFRNVASGTCLYNDAPLPLRDFARPINLQRCGASDTLWKISTTAGITTIMSRKGFRDTNFCIDVPNRTTDDVAVWNYHCGNDNLAQLFFVGL